MRIVVNKKIWLDKLFLFIIIILVPFFDSATGFLVRGESMSSGGLGTPSQLIRFTVIGIAILLIQSKDRYLFLFLGSLYLVTIEIGAYLAHSSLQGFIIGIVFAYKFIYSAFVYFALTRVFKNLNYRESDAMNVIFRSLTILCISFIFGDLIAIKVGISESFFRSSGLFSSGNGLGVLLGVCSMLMLYGFKKGFLSKPKHIIFYLITLGCLMLISTKASGVFLIINLIFLFNKLQIYYKIFFFIMLSALVTIFSEQILNFLNVAFELVIFRFENKTSWGNFIFSAREDYIDDAFLSFNQSKLIILRIIFGAGSFLSYELPSAYTMKYKMMEMDSFDTFFMYGVFGILMYLTFMTYCVSKAFKKDKILGVTTITLFMHSIFAGHTMYNGLSAMGIVYILILINNKEYHKENFRESALVANSNTSII